MWNYYLGQWGYHHRKRKRKKSLNATPYAKLFSFLQTMWSILLISSIHTATLAMQPQLVELWQCRVQYLKKFYSGRKSGRKCKQKGYPVISCHVWHIPHLLTGWLLVMSSIVHLALKHNITYKLNEGKNRLSYILPFYI